MSPVASPAVQIVDIPLSKILPHPQNPRGPVPPEAAQAMAESLKEAGQKTEIRVRPLSPEERQQHPGFEYLLIGGHVRLAGAQLAGLSTLRAVVVEPKDPNEEAMDALLDNRWEEMSWWQWDLAIEARLKADPALTQRQLAAKLGLSAAKVNNARKVVQALTPAGRELVGQSVQPLNTKNKGFLITESILLALADLGGPEEVEKGLRRVLDDHMTEAQVRQMVNPSPKVARPTATATPAPTPAQAATQAPAPERKTAEAPSDGLKELVMSGAAGALGGFLAANLKRALGTLVRRYMLHALAALGVLVLVGGSWFKGLLHSTPNPPVAASAESQPAPPAPEAPKAKPYPPIGHKPMGTTGLSRSKAPSEGKAPKGDPGQGIPSWAPEGLPLVKDFASRFYNRSYPSWEGDQDYLKARLTEDYAPVFLKQYYPPAQRVELRDKQEVQVFSNAQVEVKPLPTGPQAGGRGLGVPSQGAGVDGGTKVGSVGGSGNSAQYRVQGQITLQNRSGKIIKNLWTKPVALEIAVRHEEGMGYRVEKVTEVTPDPALNAQAGEDPLKAVQDAAGAVKNVADSVDKVDQTKKLLGL